MSATLTDRAIVGAAPAPSPEALALTRNLTWEALVEVASLAESYSCSLAEAAWRADRVTVEVHIRQLKSCLMAAIDAFKMLDAGGPADG